MWYLLSIIIELLFCMYIDVFMLLISICFLLKDGLHERFEVYTLTVQQAVLNTYYFEFRIQIGHLSYAGKALVVVLYLVFLRYTFMFKRQPNPTTRPVSRYHIKRFIGSLFRPVLRLPCSLS